METERRTELIELLRDMPRRIEDLLRGQPRNVLAWIPAPGQWTILETVCHLRDREIPMYRDVYRRIAAGDRPPVPVSDPDAQEPIRMARNERASEALRVWKRARRETVGLLAGLDAETWARQAEHPVAGPTALAALVEMQAQHDRDHLAQIESNLERRSILDRLDTARRGMRERVEILAASSPGGEPHAAARLEIARLRDFEIRMLRRYVWILERDRPVLPPLDAESASDLEGGADLAETWREFELQRGATLELLHAMSPRLWQRRGVHPHRGDLTIAELVAHHLDHDVARLAALRGLTERRPGATLARDTVGVERPRPTA